MLAFLFLPFCLSLLSRSYYILFCLTLPVRMFSNTVFTLLLFGLSAAQNGAWVPKPLPAVTPSDVVNLLIQDAADGAGDYVASVIGAVCYIQTIANVATWKLIRKIGCNRCNIPNKLQF